MKTVRELLDHQVTRRPDAPFLAQHGRATVTYGQAVDRARRLGSSLARLGIRRQDRVAILGRSSIEFNQLYVTCEVNGFILTLLNWRWAERELLHVLADSLPVALFFKDEFRETAQMLRKRCPHIGHLVSLDGAGAEDIHALADLIAAGDPAGPPFQAEADDYCYLFYTSGTTGFPKGVPWKQSGALNAARSQGMQHDHPHVAIQLLPAFHVGGKSCFLGALWNGGSIVAIDQFDARVFLRDVQEFRVTEAIMVEAMLAAILGDPELDRYDLSSLRSMLVAGGPTALRLLREGNRQIGPAFHTAYGSTETSNITILQQRDMKLEGTAAEVNLINSVGKFFPEVPGTVLDDALNPCPPGEVGEVCVKSLVFCGYWNDTNAAIEATRGGWLHTGDLGYLDENGYLFLVGRKKDVIISGGENILAREVEIALLSHEAVSEALVIGVPDERWGEVPKGFVALQPGASASPEVLIAHCETQIARFKAPKHIEFMDILPKLATGKPDKVSLRELERSRREAAAAGAGD